MRSLSFTSLDRRLAEPTVVGIIGSSFRSVCQVKLKGLRLNPYVFKLFSVDSYMSNELMI